MSRTRKGSKGPGYEYWTRRDMKNMTAPSHDNKARTARRERRKERQHDHTKT